MGSLSPNLDLVRAVAVLCVFVAHLADRARGFHADATWRVGQMGVLIFFVHTSIVLMHSLERSPLRGPALFRDFYLRRAFRIYPLAIVVVTAVAIWERWPIGAYLSHATLTLNLTFTETRCCALWSLPLEVQMYVVLPFLFLAVRRASIAAVGALWGLSVGLAVVSPFISARLSVLAWAPCFLAGVLAWWVTRRTSRRFPAWIFPGAFLATWLVWLIATREHHWYYHWAFCLVLGCVLPWFHDVSARWLTRPAHVIAKYSYGIYLTHQAIQSWALALPVPVVWQWVALGLTATFIPLILFHTIEAPLIAYGRRLGVPKTLPRDNRGGALQTPPTDVPRWSWRPTD